jgi:hypothetical protein
MSDMAKAARAAMKAKAKSLTTANDPTEKVSSTTWTPPEPLNADVKTGLRPVSRRAFKTGGKVMGVKAKANMGKKARASGGKAITADSMINRNVKEANEERSGLKHVGGMKKGGRAHKDDGGWLSEGIQRLKNNVGLGSKPKPSPFTNEESKEYYSALRENRPSEMDRKKLSDMAAAATDTRSNQEAQRKSGGRTKKAYGGPMAGASKMIQDSVQQAGVPTDRMAFGNIKKGSLSPARAVGFKKGGVAHDDVKEDKALIRKMVKPSARTKKEDGGSASLDSMNGLKPNQPKRVFDFQHELPSPEEAKRAIHRQYPGWATGDKKMQSLASSELKKGGRIKKEDGGGMPKKGSADDIERGLARNMLARSMAESKLRNARLDNLTDLSDNMGQARYTEPHDFPKLIYPGAGMKKGGRSKRADGGSADDYNSYSDYYDKNFGPNSDFFKKWKAAEGPPDDVISKMEYKNYSPSSATQGREELIPNNILRKKTRAEYNPPQNAPYSGKADYSEEKMKKGGRTKRATGGGVFSGPGYPGKVPGATGGRTAHAAGGKAGKGKTDINIIIGAGKPAGAGDMMPGGPTPPPPKQVPVPPPAAGGPPPAGMPMQMPPQMPPPMPPQGGPGGPPMGGGMPPMPRKAGGRTYRSYKDMDAGSGSGVGRLEKTEIAERAMHNKGGKVGHRNYRNYKDMDAGAASGLGRLEKTEIARKKTGIQLV